MNRLIALSYSPWSEKARWALRHHGVPHREVEYVPMLGTPWLRFTTRRFSGRVTVPTLLSESGEVVMDSCDIARWAEGRGQGAPLFPAEHLDAILHWNDRSERILAAGRALATRRTSDDADAQLEALPAFIPGAVRNLARPMAQMGVRYFTLKYDTGTGTEAERLEGIHNELLALRQALSGGDTLWGPFTFAELSMAVALQFVEPVEGHRPTLAPATRRCWRQPELAREFADLLAWRDTVYARHQP
jgi:glutathione S-transferase